MNKTILMPCNREMAKMSRRAGRKVKALDLRTNNWFFVDEPSIDLLPPRHCGGFMHEVSNVLFQSPARAVSLNRARGRVSELKFVVLDLDEEFTMCVPKALESFILEHALAGMLRLTLTVEQ